MSPSLPNLTLDGRGVVSFEDFVPFFVHGFLFGVCLVLRRYCSYRPQGGRVVMRRTVLCSAQHSRRQVEWECPYLFIGGACDASVRHCLRGLLSCSSQTMSEGCCWCARG